MVLEVDKIKLKQAFPLLKVEEENIIRGKIDFSCFYDREKDKLEYNSDNKKAIKDSYEIKINLKEKDTSGFPKVYETSEKIKKYAKTNNIGLAELHVNNEENECCLGIFPDYDKESICDFIIDKLIPFLYWQSHRMKYGKEPWEGFPSWTGGDKRIFKK